MSDSLKRAYDLVQRGKPDEALAAFRSAAREPDPTPVEYNAVRAAIHLAMLEFEAARDLFIVNTQLQPLNHNHWYNLGICEYELGRFDEAIVAHRASLAIAPGQAMTWMKLGAAHLAIRHHAEALACHERAHVLDPDNPDIMTAYGTSVNVHGDDARAEQLYRRAWRKSGHPISEAALGFVLLRQGKYEEGWQRFHARWKLRNFGLPYHVRNVELWHGKANELSGRRVLLRSEQGFGDTIHFSRYIYKVCEHAAEVFLEVEPTLAPLMETLGVPVFVRGRDALPDFDIQTSLMTLPMVFGTTIKPVRNLPEPMKFPVDPIAQPAEIGVCWHGGARVHDPMANSDDRRRSIAWEVFEPIARVAPAISLQEDALREAGVTNWLDTARRIAGLKLVITVDTAIAHLAASLGVETWVLSRKAGCWRWTEKGDTTPWYSSMRLYRQEALDMWRPVIDRVARDLHRWAKR